MRSRSRYRSASSAPVQGSQKPVSSTGASRMAQRGQRLVVEASRGAFVTNRRITSYEDASPLPALTSAQCGSQSPESRLVGFRRVAKVG
jgi:hypothetical protein